MAHLEKEYKNLLTKVQYETLKEEFQSIFTKDITQTNQYYDCHQQLENNCSALRIRLIEGQQMGEITLKIPQSDCEVIEITEELPNEQLQWWVEEDIFLLPTSIKLALEEQGIELSNISPTATLTTHRLEGLLRPGCLLVLDESHYAGQTDYEIEMEVEDLEEGKEIFLEILHRHGITPQKPISKIRRALQAFKNLG
ncbi:CYTH domain-containing protein [Granulicatella elegans]|uniref:CYTH domain-containing protein n=1 Tax=Granulicatella elegans TaxID=137732 RepID=UPI001D13CA66|nr:CYTH domain-containing protein [Granulicatella elegans]UEA31429.1 CYTH domain-containing protein [Granulicatella elegans]